MFVVVSVLLSWSVEAGALVVGRRRCLSPSVRRVGGDRSSVVRMISERQIPAYVQTMKTYESRSGVETLGPCGSEMASQVPHDDGYLVNHSVEPLFSKEETDAIISECEARAERMGGWTTARHTNYPTTAVPIQPQQAQL